MMKLACILTAFTMSSMQASAQSANYVSSFGDEYSLATNENGVVLRSIYPKAWFIENGANSHVEKGYDVIYLGKTCDAYHKVFGKGSWDWANGGFRVVFDKILFGFPRQELNAGIGMNCQN